MTVVLLKNNVLHETSFLGRQTLHLNRSHLQIEAFKIISIDIAQLDTINELSMRGIHYKLDL